MISASRRLPSCTRGLNTNGAVEYTPKDIADKFAEIQGQLGSKLHWGAGVLLAAGSSGFTIWVISRLLDSRNQNYLESLASKDDVKAIGVAVSFISEGLQDIKAELRDLRTEVKLINDPSN
ncbi:hypothetical protein WJX73_007596 [Symbiochloris irregularis]|uniref:Uncharacterized protein n=1 Tax=Symbiochloris irregularis TaxID=706552 RepID=A0AAW1NML3_9CHLO